MIVTFTQDRHAQWLTALGNHGAITDFTWNAATTSPTSFTLVVDGWGSMNVLILDGWSLVAQCSVGTKTMALGGVDSIHRRRPDDVVASLIQFMQNWRGLAVTTTGPYR